MPELLKLEKILPIFQVIEKVDDAGKVTHSVLGVATSEVEDKDGEIADYEGTNAQIKVWSDDFLQKTSASGQELSLGNIRVQHDPKQIGGKVTAIDPNEAKKQIVINTQPRDTVYDELIFPGMVTGFSIAGSYLSRKCNDCGSDIDRGKFCTKCAKVVKVRYVPSISEISYVDNPCNPDAGFIHVKANGAQELVKFEDLRKASADKCTCKCASCKKGDCKGCTDEKCACANCGCGRAKAKAVEPGLVKQIEQVLINAGVMKEKKTKRVAGEDLSSDCFAYVGDKDDPSTWKLPYKGFSTEDKNKSHVRNALARFSQTKGIPADAKAKVKAKLVAAAKKHGIEVSDSSGKAIRAAFVQVLSEQTDTKEAAETIMSRIDEVFTKAAPEAKLFKGLYTVGSLAQVMQDLQWIVASTTYERDYEGDESDVPDDLRAVLEDLIPVFVAMATEEANELLTQTKTANGGGGPMSETNADLLKAAKDAALELWKKAKSVFHKMAKEHGHLGKAHEKAAGHHENLADHHTAVAEDGADKATKDALQKLSEGDDFKKMAKVDQILARIEACEKGQLNKAHKGFAKMAKEHANLAKCHMKAAGHHDNLDKAAVAVGDAEDAIDMQEREKDDKDAEPGGSSEKATKEILAALESFKTEVKKDIADMNTKVAAVKADVDKNLNKLEETPLEKAKREKDEKEKAGIHLEHHDDDPSKKSAINTNKTAGSAQGTVGVFA